MNRKNCGWRRQPLHLTQTSREKETNALYTKVNGLVKSRKTPLPVIPAKAGIQSAQADQRLMTDLDPGFRRGDDFLRVHQSAKMPYNPALYIASAATA